MTASSALNPITTRPGLRCWVESAILGIGSPAVIWSAWALALGVGALSIASNLRFLPRMHIPISYAFFPHGFHLVSALAVGVTAGFCEEVLYRAFLITEFADAGYGRTVQVLVPGMV